MYNLQFQFVSDYACFRSDLLNMVKCIHEVGSQMTAVLQVLIKEMLVALLTIVKLFLFSSCVS